MTKKLSQVVVERKTKHRIQARDVTNDDLRAFGLKKVKQLQSKQCKQRTIHKFSKSRLQNTQSVKNQLKVQKQSFEEIIQQSLFECPICLEMMIEPTLLQCGHAYCFKCIQQLMIYKSSCGVCRNIQTEPQFQRSTCLETLIQKVILKKSQNFIDYYCRLTDNQNWKKARSAIINELSKGSFIDFRDKQLKWRKAEIIKMTLEEQSNIYIMDLKYKKQGQIIEEKINSNSGRYARFSYYTRMKYLEDRPISNVLDNSENEQILYTPFTTSFRQLADEIGGIFEDQQEETPFQQSGNIQLESSILPIINFEENQFLNEIFRNEENQALDFIQILA